MREELNKQQIEFRERQNLFKLGHVFLTSISMPKNKWREIRYRTKSTEIVGMRN